jgi:hypothetical protein
MVLVIISLIYYLAKCYEQDDNPLQSCEHMKIAHRRRLYNRIGTDVFLLPGR